MIRNLTVVLAFSFMFSACESQQFGTLKFVKQPNSPFSKLVYIEPTEAAFTEAEVDPVTTAAPRPASELIAIPDPSPNQQPSVSTSGSQSDEPTVITCEVC